MSIRKILIGFAYAIPAIIGLGLAIYAATEIIKSSAGGELSLVEVVGASLGAFFCLSMTAMVGVFHGAFNKCKKGYLLDRVTDKLESENQIIIDFSKNHRSHHHELSSSSTSQEAEVPFL